MSSAFTNLPSSLRSRFSRRILRLKGSRSALPSASLARASSRKIVYLPSADVERRAAAEGIRVCCHRSLNLTESEFVASVVASLVGSTVVAPPRVPGVSSRVTWIAYVGQWCTKSPSAGDHSTIGVTGYAFCRPSIAISRGASATHSVATDALVRIDGDLPSTGAERRRCPQLAFLVSACNASIAAV